MMNALSRAAQYLQHLPDCRLGEQLYSGDYLECSCGLPDVVRALATSITCEDALWLVDCEKDAILSGNTQGTEGRDASLDTCENIRIRISGLVLHGRNPE